MARQFESATEAAQLLIGGVRAFARPDDLLPSNQDLTWYCDEGAPCTIFRRGHFAPTAGPENLVSFAIALFELGDREPLWTLSRELHEMLGVRLEPWGTFEEPEGGGRIAWIRVCHDGRFRRLWARHEGWPPVEARDDEGGGPHRAPTAAPPGVSEPPRLPAVWLNRLDASQPTTVLLAPGEVAREAAGGAAGCRARLAMFTSMVVEEGPGARPRLRLERSEVVRDLGELEEMVAAIGHGLRDLLEDRRDMRGSSDWRLSIEVAPSLAAVCARVAAGRLARSEAGDRGGRLEFRAATFGRLADLVTEAVDVALDFDLPEPRARTGSSRGPLRR